MKVLEEIICVQLLFGAEKVCQNISNVQVYDIYMTTQTYFYGKQRFKRQIKNICTHIPIEKREREDMLEK